MKFDPREYGKEPELMPGPIDYMKDFERLMASTEVRVPAADALTPLEEKSVRRLMRNKRLLAKGIRLEHARQDGDLLA